MDDDTEDPNDPNNVIHGDFGSKPTEEEEATLLFRIGVLTFGDVHGGLYSFEPRPDITVLELSNVVQLFLVSIIHSKVHLDRIGFMAENNLNRHFIYTPKGIE